MAHKIQKALYGPSIVEVIFGAILGLLAGVLAACIYLVFKPVPTVRELPKEQPRGMVYYLPGSESKVRGAAWQTKQKQFLSGTTVQLVEDELNSWLTSSVKLDAAPVAGKSGATAPAGDNANQIFTPTKPNFKIANNKLQVGVNCTLNWYGMMTDVTLQSTGTFTKDGDHFVYSPDTLYLGSCPLHFLPGVSPLLMTHLLSKGKVPDEFRDAWYKLNDVVVSGNSLRLVTSP